MSEEQNHMPKGWTVATLGEITVPKVEQRPPSETAIPYIDISSIDRQQKAIGDLRNVNVKDAPTRARQWVKTGDVLVSMTRPNLNAVALVPEKLDGAVASTGFDVLRATRVLPQWIFNRVRSHAFVADVCEDLQGVVYPAIRPHDVRAHELPLPPLPEQHRIVEAIESHLTRLDDAVASLERVQRNLKRYRASVLKAAVEGRLVPTEAELARKEGRDYEPASVLLERILEERRRRCIEDAAEKGRAKAEDKAKKAGKPWTAKDNTNALEAERAKAASKYEEPTPPDTDGLPELPKGWCWTTLSHLIMSGPQNGVYIPQSRYGSGIPILRIDDYQLDWSRNSTEFKQIDVLLHEAQKYMLAEGDIVVNRVNSLTHLGKSLTISQRHLPAAFESNIMRFGLSRDVLPAYCQHYLSSVSGRHLLTANAKWAVNQASINQTDVGNTPVPLPPVTEQKRIVVEIDRLLSTSEGILQAAKISASRCSRLRQSILKWAFEGKLVDQDPNDEPASVLLERIKAARDNSDEGKKPRPRGRKRRVG